MPHQLSLLDKCPIQRGESATAALERVTGLAQSAERMGFRRFWLAEHHGSPALASSVPEILIAHLLARTSRIRVGAGGVMLQHYSAYKVAETFNTLASLAPGRMDLGVGKSPGGFPHSTQALQSGRDRERWPSFAEQVRELGSCLDRRFERGAPTGAVAAPVPTQQPDRFLLGGSVESAILAAESNWQFVFAAHINGNPDLIARSLAEYRKCGGRHKPILTVLALAAEPREEAASAVDGIQTLKLTLPDGHSVNLMNREQAVEYARQACAETYTIVDTRPGVLAGTTGDVYQELEAMHRRYGVDEFVIETPMVSPQAKRRSIELLGDSTTAWQRAS